LLSKTESPSLVVEKAPERTSTLSRKPSLLAKSPLLLPNLPAKQKIPSKKISVVALSSAMKSLDSSHSSSLSGSSSESGSKESLDVTKARGMSVRWSDTPVESPVGSNHSISRSTDFVEESVAETLARTSS
jgi:hypothetical protein